MREETTLYREARRSDTTAPRVFVRPAYVRKAGDATSYDFLRDFTSHPVLSETVAKIVCIPPGSVRGNTQKIDPVSLRSEIGQLAVPLVNVDGEITKYIADPARQLETAIAATTTYILKGTNSDLAGGAEFNLNLAEGAGVAADKTVSIAASATEDGYAFTTAGLPGADGGTGSMAHEVKVNVVVANANLNLTVFVARVNAAGVVQSGPVAVGAEQGLGAAGVKTFNVSTDLGAWLAGDRLRVTYRFRNTAGSIQTCDIKTESATSIVTGPWKLISYVEVDDARGYAALGHVTLDQGDAALEEDIKYTGKDITTTPNRLTGAVRGARGTKNRAHAAGTLVRNGEQLRRGTTRLTLFAGYEELGEADYMTYVRMEVTDVKYDSRLLAWTLTAQDVQRLLKKLLFETASPLDVTVLGPEHPLNIMLKVLMSTGAATNGPYDVLPAEDSAGIAQTLVDVEGIELVRSGLPGLLMKFRETEPQEVKSWMETQILRPLNLVWYIKQDGLLSVRRFGTPPFRNQGINLPNCVVALT